MLKLAPTAGSGSVIAGLMAPRVPFIVTAFAEVKFNELLARRTEQLRIENV